MHTSPATATAPVEARRSSSSSSSSSTSSSSGYASSTSSATSANTSPDIGSASSSASRLFTFKCDLNSQDSDSHTTITSPIARIFPTYIHRTPSRSSSQAHSFTRSEVRPNNLRSRSPKQPLGQRRRISSRTSSHRQVPALRSSLPLNRCQELWFNDGNIILIAENQFAFKVHRGVLARHSEVFADMFGIPQPMDMEIDDEMEGCQHVQMAHDCADDVYYFLKSLYDGLHLLKKHRSTQFPLLMGTLRLSTKYFSRDLRERCLDQLSFDWPTTLDGWDSREAEATDDHGTYLPREYSAHPVIAIEFAREMGLVNVLPSALYDLSRYGPSKIVVGAPGAKRVMKQEREKSKNVLPDASRVVTLPHDLFVKTLKGRECSQKFVHAFIMNHIGNRTAAMDCLYGQNQSKPCLESFYYITLNVLRAVGGIACGRDADPLFTIAQAMDMLSRVDFVDGSGGRRYGLRLCGACKADFSDDCIKARKVVWMSLPKWFGLDEVVGSSWGVEKSEKQVQDMMATGQD